MSASLSVEVGRVEPLLDDGLPLVDFLAQPVITDVATSGVRPFAQKFQITHKDDPDFIKMVGNDVTYTSINHWPWFQRDDD